MKKIFTLSLVAVFAISAMAQHVSFRNSDARAMAKANRIEKKLDANRQLMTQEEHQAVRAAKAARVAADVADTLQWIRPYGAFFANSKLPMLISDTTSHLEFYDASALHTGDSLYWGAYANDQLYLLSDSAFQPYMNYPEALGATLQAGYEYTMPILFTADAEGYVLQTYQHGKGLGDNYRAIAAAYPQYAENYNMLAQYADHPVIYVRPEETMSITTCALYTDSLIGEGYPYDDFPLSRDSAGNYLYGTGFVQGTKTVDTLVVIFDNLSTMWLDSATLEVYSHVENMIPAGAEVKLEIVPAGMNQDYQWVIGTQVLATAVATQTDLTGVNPFSDGSGYYGYLNFAFGAKNALGGFSPAPVTIDGVFAVRIILNNAQGNNFGIYSDYYYPEGQSFFLIDGALRGYYWSNMNLSLNAKFVAPEVEAVEAVKGDAVKPVKEFRNGQVLILKGEKVYNVMGVEL